MASFRLSSGLLSKSCSALRRPRASRDGEGYAFRVGLPQGQTGRVVVVVAEDGMSASASVITGDVAGAEELDAALALAGVSSGIDEIARAELAALLGDTEYTNARAELAVGTPPYRGQDGWFEPSFHVGIQPGHLASDGTIDFYDRELLKPATPDQELGWLRSQLPGTEGRNVRGAVLPPPAVKPAAVRFESGVAVGIDGVVRATRAGVIVYVEGKSLDVSTHVVHKGAIDLRSGSLETRGSLTVRGDIQPSFSVRAEGDVVVEGTVDGGTLIAGGNIQVRGGVQGGYAGVVCAQGDLTARHADRATLKAGGGINLESATHCELSADWIRVSHAVRGGRVAAQRSVVTQEAGSPRGSISTTLAAAVVLDSSLADVMDAFVAAKARRTLERQSGGALRGNGARPKGGKLGLESVALQREELARRLRHAQNRERLLPTAFVEVGGTAYAGTMIVLGEHRLLLERDVTAVRFSVDPESRTICVSSKS
jgi:hypothetical protein